MRLANTGNRDSPTGGPNADVIAGVRGPGARFGFRDVQDGTTNSSHGGDAARRNAEDAEAAENRNPPLGSSATRVLGTLISRPGEIDGRRSMARSARFFGCCVFSVFCVPSCRRTMMQGSRPLGGAESVGSLARSFTQAGWASRCYPSLAYRTGTTSVKVLPDPGADSTSTRPPSS